MSGKRMLYFGLTLLVTGIAYSGWKVTARSAYESAEYSVIESDGPFDVREYPTLTMVTTRMRIESRGDEGSFMRLFRYISGANDRQQKVAMTTPVFMKSDANDHQGQMGFVVPATVTEQRVPEPSNGRVEVRERPGGRFAVIRFSGRMNSESFTKNEGDLRKWIGKQGLTGVGHVELAGYDPPWTPGPLRRNEILIRLE